MGRHTSYETETCSKCGHKNDWMIVHDTSTPAYHLEAKCANPENCMCEEKNYTTYYYDEGKLSRTKKVK